MQQKFLRFVRKSMICFPNCKINLGLNITAKRQDGFHELQTIFYPLALSDCLEIIPASASGFSFTTSGMVIPSDGSKNICEKAYDLIRQRNHIPAVQMHLHKSIPIGAGLGGGSSDAAFTLTLLNNLFELNIAKDELKALAAQLGSDCAFFIENTPSIASGRGEKLTPFPLQLKGFNLALVMPPIHVSTAEAYAGIHPQQPLHDLSKITTETIDSWKEIIVNDFESHIFEKYPRIKEIKEKLYSLGALYASMSGSGAAVFGIFSKDISRDVTEDIFRDSFVWTETLKI
jgi:4-diphosphocytidyl-2-C-methyl-D-erythritol kinase